jgi:uncharacterized protein with beta-barrel porin domain
VVAGAVLAVVLAVGGPFVYLNYRKGDAPERLVVATATTGGGTAGTEGSLDGTWTVGGGSEAGYRGKEVLLGQDTEAVGRTTAVTGELTLHGTTRPVTVQVAVRRSGDTVDVGGSIPVTFADYGIANPSFGPVTTEDNGEIEFLLAFTRG